MPSSAFRLSILAAASIVALSACSKGAQNTSTTATQSVTTAPVAEASPDAVTPAPPAEATATGATAPPAAAGTAAAAPAASAAASTSSAATSAPLSKAAFTDINGADGADAIRQLAFLGVLDNTSGQFRPHDPISRAEYVRWLVRANNAYFTTHPEKRIRLAETGQATFLDVPPWTLISNTSRG
jgi:hypothetical protein